MARNVNIENQKLLVEIALDGRNSRKIRMHALEKINDQKALGFIANNVKEDLEIRVMAVKKISDKNVLNEVLKNVDGRIRAEIAKSNIIRFTN